MNKLYYAVQHKQQNVTLKSGSGGMFYTLSKYVMDKNGIVYGASFSKDFTSVNIVRCDNVANLDKLLCSKYLMSNAKDSFSLVKQDLDDNKLVLYSGLPCQIHVLKAYLKKDYDNLICVECVCHGILSENIWQDYLNSIKKHNQKVVSVNMRDKRLGWNDYGMSIKFDDNTEFFEKHQDNKYMKAFLSDKYLNNSCYNCKFKNNYSKADLSIGDFWGATSTNILFDKKYGVNVVVINTEKGLEIFNSLSNINKKELTKELASKYNGGMSNTISTQPAKYNKNIFNRDNKVAILTLNFNDNIGGVLQSYALQKFLSNNFYDATTIQSHDYWHSLSFVKNKKLKTRVVTNFKNIENDFDSYIVGSDQVWRREFISGKWKESWKSWKPLFLDFAKDWSVNKIAYSASYGTNSFDFKDCLKDVKDCLNEFDAISMREIDASNYIKELTNKDVITTCDPTMLLNKEDYVELCKDCAKKEGELFAYILDKNMQIENIINNSNMSRMTLKQNSVEDWLACYRDCKCIVTDSFHGVVFSIIFNKPFICVYNKGRGGSRFDTLIELFNIKDRVVTSEKEVDYKLLEKCPNIDYTKFIEYSKEFLLSNLEKRKEKHMKKVKPVFGIISWFPDAEPARSQRITRLTKMFKQIQDLFGDVNYMIIAQNWKDYKLPDIVKNVDIFRYEKLGILGARKKLGEHFLLSNYDYLIMCDDDIILKTDSSFTKEYFFDELNRHSEGFVFLKYGWSLTFCAISKYIYSQSPMLDIDPEKGEGYEDTVWPYLLHYKHSDKEFTLSGIEFIQNQAEFVKELKSTWCDKNTDHKKLHAISKYHINQFKKGNYIVDKKKAEEMTRKYDWYIKAIFKGWCSIKEYQDFMKNFE